MIPSGEAEDGIEHGFCSEWGGLFKGLSVGFERKRDCREDYGVSCGFPAMEGDDVLGGVGRVGMEVGEDTGFGFEDWVSIPARGFLYGQNFLIGVGAWFGASER